MRVLFFTPQFLPHIGGVERHVWHVSRELIARGHKVSIITPCFPGSPEHEAIDGIDVHRIPSSITGGWSGTLSSLPKAWSAIARHRALIRGCDVIHGHDYTVLLWVMPMLPILGRRNVFITFHGAEGEVIPRYARPARKLEEAFTKGSICIGNYLSKWYGTRCGEVTYCGVDPRPSSQVPREKAALFVGRIARDQPILEYVRVVSMLGKDHAMRLRLVVAGEGPLVDDMKALASKLEVELEYLGLQEDPLPLYEKCLVFLAGGYLSISESIASGTPSAMLASTPLRKDIFTTFPLYEHGFIVADGPEELARRIAGMLNDKEGTDEKIKGGQKILERMRWSDVADCYERLWGVK